MRIKLEKEDGEMSESDEYIKASLCPLLRLQDPWTSIAERCLYESGKKVDIERNAVSAYEWSNMYLTNPPLLLFRSS